MKVKFISVALLAVCTPTILAHMIATPVYTLKRNIDAKPRAMRAREEQLRKRLQRMSQSQRTLTHGVVDLDGFRDWDELSDICKISSCRRTGESIDDSFMEDGAYDCYDIESAITSWVRSWTRR